MATCYDSLKIGKNSQIKQRKVSRPNFVGNFFQGNVSKPEAPLCVEKAIKESTKDQKSIICFSFTFINLNKLLFKII